MVLYILKFQFLGNGVYPIVFPILKKYEAHRVFTYFLCVKL